MAMNEEAPVIRPEEAADRAAIARLVTAAFGRDGEARLVDRLRQDGDLVLSLLAVEDGEPVGHVALSPVTLGAADGRGRWLGLAPLAVAPARQRRGIGGRLVEAALRTCGQAGVELVFLLGEPAFYGRFGFTPACRHGWRCAYDAPDGAFQVRPVGRASPLPPPGLVLYAPAFDDLA